MYDVIIIGAGPAGITAGIYAKRFGLDTIMFSSPSQTPQPLLTSDVENYPGFKKILGSELMQKFTEHVESFGVEIKYETVVEIKKKDDHIEIVTDSNNNYQSKALIIATGAHHRTAGIDGEEEFLGRGVSYCATCDGAFFRGKKVVVVGGGDSALVGALYLNSIGCDVTVVHRRNEFRAANMYVERAKERGLNLVTPHTIKKIFGKDKVEGVILDDGTKIECDGVFVLIGEVPTVDIAKKAGIKTNERNFIVVDEYKMTNIPGIFAAGDVTNTVLRQIITAASDGAIAALGAYNYIKGEKM